MRLAALPLLIPLACGTTAPAPQPEEPAPEAAPAPAAPAQPTSEQTHTTAWTCGAESVVLVARASGSATLEHAGKRYTLRADEASRDHFVGEGVTFRAQAADAVLGRGGVETPCTFDTAATTWWEARDRGVTLRATGQEPGWLLEIGPDRIVLVANYGELRVKTPLSDPIVDAAERSTTWRGKSDGHALAATAVEGACTDAMSGESFPLRVSVTLDWQTWSGCGRTLR